MSKNGGATALSVVFGVLALQVLVVPERSQAQVQKQGNRTPLAADGHPDLNGIWQALNTANYDLEPHSARHAMALRPGPHGPVPAKEVLYLGAVGAVPGGMGVEDSQREPREVAGARPGDQMLPAGSAARHLHALPFPHPSEPQRVRDRI